MESFFVSGKPLGGNWGLMCEEATVLAFQRKWKSVKENIRDVLGSPNYHVGELAFVQSFTFTKHFYVCYVRWVLYPHLKCEEWSWRVYPLSIVTEHSYTTSE